MTHEDNTYYNVKFFEPDLKKYYDVFVKDVFPSEIIGLVTLQDFYFRDQTKNVLLTSEEEARKRFSKTERMHIPYQHITYVEEIYLDEIEHKSLPFIRQFPKTEIPPTTKTLTNSLLDCSKLLIRSVYGIHPLLITYY